MKMSFEEINKFFIEDKQKQYEEYMGPEFQAEWKYPKDFLHGLIIRKYEELEHLKRNNAPDEMINGYQDMLETYNNLFKEEKYAQTESEESYYYDFEDKHLKFRYDYTELNKLLDEDKVSEIKRRYNILLDHIFEMHPISSGMAGIQLNFMMTLHLIGPSLQPEPWMDEEYMKPILTNEEYSSGIYYGLIESLQNEMIEKYKNDKHFEGLI